MDFFNGAAWWITPEDDTIPSGGAGRAILFRKRFQGKGQLRVAVSADSEYRLFCNGAEVARGPAYGDAEETFYDEVDLTELLTDGENELFAEVVGFASAAPDFYRGGAPMARVAYRDAFLLDGTLIRDDGRREFIGTDAEYEAAAAPNLAFFRCPGIPAAGPGEQCSGPRGGGGARFAPVQTIEPGFRRDTVKNAMLPYRLTPRRIPLPHRERNPFLAAFDCAGTAQEAVETMLRGGTLRIAPRRRIDFTLDAGRETTARPILHFLGGRVQTELRYAENLFRGGARHFQPELPHDPVEGPMTDRVNSPGGEWRWSPFFFRAFRFVRVILETGEEPCELALRDAEEEHYPYQFCREFRSSDAELDRLCRIGRRTLELCSHGILEDCPYYERLQYPADSRIAARLGGFLSGDVRLARQAVAHFRRSIRDEGLTAGSAPTRCPVLLPFWSLHYAAMVDELYRFTGDETILRENLRPIRGVLEFFLRHRAPGGGIGPLPYWGMADFTGDWSWLGEPPGLDRGASAYATFFTAECLSRYAGIAGILRLPHEKSHAEELYRQLADESRIFFDPRTKLYADTPELDSFSLLANAEAVLAGMPHDPELLCRCMKRKELETMTLFGRTFLFDALLRCGQKALAAEVLDSWRSRLVPGRTVFPEGTVVPRSECHVWSALPPLGVLRLYAGFRLLTPGGREIGFDPYLPPGFACRGAVALAAGTAEFDFSPESLRVKLPSGIALRWRDKIIPGSGDWLEPDSGTDTKEVLHHDENYCDVSR